MTAARPLERLPVGWTGIRAGACWLGLRLLLDWLT